MGLGKRPGSPKQADDPGPKKGYYDPVRNGTL